MRLFGNTTKKANDKDNAKIKFHSFVLIETLRTCFSRFSIENALRKNTNTWSIFLALSNKIRLLKLLMI